MVCTCDAAALAFKRKFKFEVEMKIDDAVCAGALLGAPAVP